MRAGWKRLLWAAPCAATIVASASATGWPSLGPPSGGWGPPSRSEPLRVLGKMLFFEEQLSSDDTVACATCHAMTIGGSDARKGTNPGRDLRFGTLGDVQGSPGVAAMDEQGRYRPSKSFGLAVQVTPRTAPPVFAAAYNETALWDGAAGATFLDPATNEVLLASGGALENQALRPLTNDLEMGHAERDLAQVVAKLAAARPLALAGSLTDDLAAALADDPDYTELFRRAFGDGEITAARIALAIAAYERTLVPDDTPFDRFANGDSDALTDQEQRGLDAMVRVGCTKCHAPPLFTDGKFHATGVRPASDDGGRREVTQDALDRGKFKVPTLRNAALKETFFHDGVRTELGQAVSFYAVEPGPPNNGQRRYTPVVGNPHPDTIPSVQFTDNQDPVMSTIQLGKADAADVFEFIRNGLVDRRVIDGLTPFDVPQLGSERLEHRPYVLGTGRSDDGDVPGIVVRTPSVAGSDRFTVTLAGGNQGDLARLVSWAEPTEDGLVTVSDAVQVAQSEGVAYASRTVPLASDAAGSRLQFAWRLEDVYSPAAKAYSPVVSVPVFAARSASSGGSDAARAVDDGDAWIESARLRVELQPAPGASPRDRLTLRARIPSVDASTPIAEAWATVTWGGVRIVDAARMDSHGRLSLPHGTGRLDLRSGRLTLKLSKLDLRDAVLDPSSVPVRIELEGVPTSQPVTVTTLRFDTTRGTTAARLDGRFSYAASGTGNGVFRAGSAKAQKSIDGFVRLRLKGVIDAPLADAFAAPDGVDVTVGEGAGALRLDRVTLTPTFSGAQLRAEPSGNLLGLTIDVPRRTFALDATVRLADLTDAPPGSRVTVPVTLTTRGTDGTPPVTYATDVSVVAPRR